MNENNNLIDIHENPLDLFTKWFEEANSKEINDPNATIVVKAVYKQGKNIIESVFFKLFSLSSLNLFIL